MSNELTTVKELKIVMQDSYVQEKFRDILGKNAPAFITSVLTVVSNNELLSKADPKSIINAATTAATLDLPINQNLGFAYIIPYYDSKSGKTLAQFQMGYKGFIQLAQRSGQFKTINVSDVREGEITGTNRLTGEITFDWKDNRDNLKVIGYVGFIKLINGFEKSFYMTVKELGDHGMKYSKNFAKYGTGLWKDDFDAMASKTVIKLLLSKYAPQSTQMQTAQLADQAIIKEENQYEYVDNEKLMPEKVSAAKERERIIKHIDASDNLDVLNQCEPHIVDEETRQLFDKKKADLISKIK